LAVGIEDASDVFFLANVDPTKQFVSFWSFLRDTISFAVFYQAYPAPSSARNLIRDPERLRLRRSSNQLIRDHLRRARARQSFVRGCNPKETMAAFALIRKEKCG